MSCHAPCFTCAIRSTSSRGSARLLFTFLHVARATWRYIVLFVVHVKDKTFNVLYLNIRATWFNVLRTVLGTY